MSYSSDECYDVYRERETVARRPHVCSACGEVIKTGHRYWRIAAIGQGTVDNIKRCLRCQATHVHLRRLCAEVDPYGGVMWPDERLSCGLKYEHEWEGPPPDSIVELTLMTADDAQAAIPAGADLHKMFGDEMTRANAEALDHKPNEAW